MATASKKPPPPDDPPAIDFGFQSRDIVPVIAIAAGIASALSGQQPTGNAAADIVLALVFGVGVTWIACYASARTLVISAVLALFFTGLQFPSVLMAAVATASAIFLQPPRRFSAETRSIGAAVSAAFTSQAVLNLPNVGFTGSASLLAAISIAPIVWTGYRNLPRPLARRVGRAALAALALAAIASVLAVVAALGVRDHIETGIQQAEDGVAAVQAGDQPRALSLLEASQANFERSRDRLGGPMTWAARFVPITAQHSRALETAAEQGSALARTAARTVVQADVEQIRGQNGEIDLTLVEAVNAELTVARATLIDAQLSLQDVDTPWLLPALSRRLDSVQEELTSTALDIDLANHATTVLPGMLGADSPRRYLVLFAQPSESREFGGFVGAYAILDVDQGRLSLAESGGIDVDLGTGAAEFTDPSAFPEAYRATVPHINPQNLTAIADLPTIARAAQDLVPQWREDADFTIDGVVTIDPYAMAGLLELSGPVVVEGLDEPLDAANVVDFLLRDQYLAFSEAERDARQDVLRVLAGEAFRQLLTIEIPGPERLGAVLGPAARADRLSFTTFNEAENAFLDRIYLSAQLPEVGSAVEMLGVYGQTGTAGKLDGYASRTTTYEVTVDPATGVVNGALEIIERNEAPADAGSFVLGEPGATGPTGEPLGSGSNFLAMGLYTRSEVSDFASDTPFRVDETEPVYSYQRHRLLVEIPRDGQARMTASTASVVEPGRYDIYIPAQATAAPSEFTLVVRPAPGWRVTTSGAAPDGTWTSTFVLDEARGFRFTFERTD